MFAIKQRERERGGRAEEDVTEVPSVAQGCVLGARGQRH